MTTTYHHTRNRNGEPVWVIKVTGWHDIYRVAAFFIYQQCEFIAAGAKALQWLRRDMGARRFEALNETMAGTGTKVQRAVTRASIRPRAER